jgi:hypothetical protein
VPLPSESGGEAMSYRFIVGGMLERESIIRSARCNAAPKAPPRLVLSSMDPEASHRLLCCGRAAKPNSMPKAWPWSAGPPPIPPHPPARSIRSQSKSLLGWGALGFKELEQVLIEKADQLFRNIL